MNKTNTSESSLFRFNKVPDLGLIAAILAFTFSVFYLDILTGEKVTFYIFYFPSIIAVAWRFGWRAGLLTVTLSLLMWTIAQKGILLREGTAIFVWNVAVRLASFLFVCAMASAIRGRGKLLETTSRELARSNAELEEFAFRAAHDLKAPLATILGFTQYLEEKYEQNCEKETKACMEGITKGVWRMNAIVKALLDYATVAKKETALPVVELNTAVTEALENLRAAIAGKKAQVVCEPLPSLAVNPSLMGLLFQNLIGNAIKYCEREPRIHISAERKGNEWLFSVQDNGIGIPAESRERVFIMFEKLETSRAYSGSGIGLATCQKIVERYGGRIWVGSSPKDGSAPSAVAGHPGDGTTFFFTLPALPAAGNA